MAISTDALIDFFGTQTSVDDGSTSAITDGSFSVAADISTFTNNDDAPFCVMVFRCQWATLPTDHTSIDIFARKLNIEGTNDSPVPDAANLDQRIGAFTVDGTVAINTNTFLVTDWLRLPNHKSIQEYDFYFQNNSGQTITAGWAAWITPATGGPHT